MMDEEFTLAAVVTDLDRAEEADRADALEFRMDYADDPLGELRGYEGELPIIATNRSEREGGEASGPGRLAVLAEAAGHRAVTAVDVELDTIEEGRAAAVLAACERSDTAVIASWHDFGGTPGKDGLERRLRAAIARGTIGKVAVTASGVADVLALLSITHRLSSEGHAVATMSMGAAGRHSRIVAPLYGSRIGYAPIDPAEATAPGQYDLATMAELLAALR